MAPQLIFDFNSTADKKQWSIVNDTVMGGRSTAQLSLTEEGHGEFVGHVSLKNNGGFSMIQFDCNAININHNNAIRLHVKGDGKTYNLRVKHAQRDRHSYQTSFLTTGEWQTINIPLSDLEPVYRGRSLTIPNFEADEFEQIAILIGNKKEESFKLLIDAIHLVKN